MTTLSTVDATCLACGAVSIQRCITSTSSFGPSDLDLRPSAPARSALPFQVQECPGCGYCAPNIAEGDSFVATAVRDDGYAALRGSDDYPTLARRFACASWLLEVCNDDAPAGWAMLSAAGACDDADEELAACICRARAVPLFRIAEDEDEEVTPGNVWTQALIATSYAGRGSSTTQRSSTPRRSRPRRNLASRRPFASECS